MLKFDDRSTACIFLRNGLNYYNWWACDENLWRGQKGPLKRQVCDKLTAEGVNPSSRSVFEKSVRENCFLQPIHQSNEL